MARHRRFTLEFKRLVVLDFLEKRQGLRELARKHNLSRNLLSQWIRKYETGQLTDQIADAHRIAEYEGKIAELERKVGQLTMEIDLLKKGARWARRPNDEIISSNSIVSGPQVSPSRADAER
jgi:transposase